MIANRFTPIETTPAGIKARDQDTAQTVLLVDVRHLDARVVGVFHPALITVFAIVEYAGRTLAAILTTKGKARLSLTSAIGGDEMLDVNELKLILKTIGGQPTEFANQAQSAAVLAAALRS